MTKFHTHTKQQSSLSFQVPTFFTKIDEASSEAGGRVDMTSPFLLLLCTLWKLRHPDIITTVAIQVT